MIYQNDKDAHPTIKKYGCYYYSLLAGIFKKFEYMGTLTHKFATDFWVKELANNRADIRDDCLIENPQNLVDDLVGPGKIKFLGKLGLNYIPSRGDIVIQYWVTDKGQTHFTLATDTDKLITEYDPWAPTSPWRTNGKLTGFRVFRHIIGV